MQASCKQKIENMHIPSQSFNSVSPALETGIAKFLNWRGGSSVAIFCQLFQMGFFVCCTRHFVLSRGSSRNSWLLVNNYLKHLSGTCTYVINHDVRRIYTTKELLLFCALGFKPSPLFFSSSEPKAQVRFSDQNLSVVRCPSSLSSSSLS